jgi:hypothetical protein
MTETGDWELFVEEPLRPAVVGGFDHCWYDPASRRCAEIRPEGIVNRYAIWSFTDSIANDCIGARWRFLTLLQELGKSLHKHGGFYLFTVGGDHEKPLHARLEAASLRRRGIHFLQAQTSPWRAGTVQDLGALCQELGPVEADKHVHGGLYEYVLLTPNALSAEEFDAGLARLALGRWPVKAGGPELPIFLAVKDYFEWCMDSGYVLMLFTGDERHAKFPTFYSAASLRNALTEAMTSWVGRPTETHRWKHRRGAK